MSDWSDDEAVGELRIELGWICREISVEKTVVLLCRDVVESLQGLHWVSRTDLFEESL